MRALMLVASLAALAVPSTPASARGGESVRLVAADTEANDQFGSAVAVAGARAIVGALNEDELAPFAGAVYVFDAVTGQELDKLVASDGEFNDVFGASVAASGTTVVVGAPQVDGRGAVYVFDVTSGQELFKLVADDGAYGDHFGTSVAVDGTTAIVGALGDDEHGSNSGAAYLFDTTTGQQLAKFVPADGAAGDVAGARVAIHGSRAVVSAYSDDDAGPESGAAYLIDVPSGQQLAKLLPGDGASGDYFGWGVAIRGDDVLIGASGADGTAPGDGAAYLFDAATGQERARLGANDPNAYDRFGSSVALGDGLALIGAHGDNESAGSAGAAYLFDTATGQEIAKLRASDGQGSDQLGRAVAIDGAFAVVGAPFENDAGLSAGAAYVFDASRATARPYCFGDDSGTACPCGNAGLVGRGCANSASAEGARLWGDGAPCVGSDTLVLRVWHSPPHQPGLFFQGDDALNGGAGIAFGDGLRCAGTNVLRLEVDAANANGRSATTVPIAALTGVSAGDVKRFQWWYRDPGASPCGAGFNLSNGVEVVWGP